MSKRILWLDNDPAYLEPYLEVLKDCDYEVRVAVTVTDAEKLLRIARYDLMILDVMVPTKDADEESRYLPDATDRGLKTGLVFYKLNKTLLEESRTAVLVMTVRLDEALQREFIQEGLPRASFVTKFSVRRTNTFLDKVNSLI